MKKNLLLILLVLSACFTKAQSTLANSLNFDGVNDNVTRGVVSTLASGVTYEARVRALAPSAGNKYIMYNGTNGTNGFGMYLQASTNTVVVKVGSAVYTTSYVIPTGTLTLLSCVFTGPNALSVYANGTLVHTFFPSPATAPSGSFAIGSDDAGANFFGGDIDEVRYWNRIVCAAEIMHRVSCQAVGNEPQLVALYRLNQGVAGGANPTVTVAIDSSPSSYTATLNNFALTGATSNWVSVLGAAVTACSFAPNTVTVTPAGTVTTCAGTPATLTATGAFTYTWSTGSTGSVTVQSPTATTNYSVVGQSGSCYGMALKTVSVNPVPPVSAFSSTNNLCIGQSAVLTGSGAVSFTWMPSGSSGMTISVSPTVNTTYTIMGTGANGCTNTAVFTQSVQSCSTGMQQLSNTGDFNIYPNPTSGAFTVEMNTISNSSKLEIYNAVGQLIWNTDLNTYSTRINTDQMSTGIYIVRIKEGNSVVNTFKLIKE